jgi:hypothetical protein
MGLAKQISLAQALEIASELENAGVTGKAHAVPGSGNHTAARSRPGRKPGRSRKAQGSNGRSNARQANGHSDARARPRPNDNGKDRSRTFFKSPEGKEKLS